MGNCLTRHQRFSEDDYPSSTIFPYPFPPAPAYNIYAPPPRQSYHPNTHYDPPSYPYPYKYKPHPSSSSSSPKTYNLHPYPTSSRPLGPIHRAAQKENITLRHIPGGCYRHGRCERLHHRSTLRELRQRGVDPRGLSIRQALRVARGYPAGLRGDGDQDGRRRRGSAQGNLGQGVLGMVEEDEWGCGRGCGCGSGRMRGRAVGGSEMGGERHRRRAVGGSEMGGGFADGVSVRSGSGGSMGGGGRGPYASHSGMGEMGSQRGGRGMDYEYAGSGGGRGNGWENHNSEYDDHHDDNADYV